MAALREELEVYKLIDEMDAEETTNNAISPAFTQEPELGREAGTDEDENEYDGDTSNLNTIDENESDDDDILYQSSGVIPANSMAPPPRPPLYKPCQQKPQSKFHTPKPVQSQRLSSSGAAYPSEPDILAQFGQELGPRIAEYVSRQKSVDEGSIDPKWRTPALPAATAGKRPILKSIILQPDTERSPSPNGNSLWATEKKPRRRRHQADKKDEGPSGESETVVRDGTAISRERITRSRVSTEAAHQPKSPHIDAPQNPPQQDLVSEGAGQNPDDEPFGDNETGNSTSVEEPVANTSHNSGLVKRKNRRPGLSEMCVPRNKYTDAEDKQMLEWAKWVYNDTEYGFWGEPHWELLSKKNPRHSGTAFRQRYRKFYDRNGGRHPFLESGMADQDAPNDLSVKLGPPTDSGSTVRAPRSDQATEGPPFNQHTIFKTIMTFQDVSKPLGVQPIPPAKGSSVAGTPKLKDCPARKRFEPFKKIIHELYMVERYSLEKMMIIMELRYAFIEHRNQYKRQFKIWGFKKHGLASHVESETLLGLDQADGGESEDTMPGCSFGESAEMRHNDWLVTPLLSVVSGQSATVRVQL
ncbi:hypothetical protein VE00_08326 [Pseudogymnoascus sp. WSF 3629]|nr:hypothetical protein VE00_08326 [Pseudogymnoascus sp. WSF 3629]